MGVDSLKIPGVKNKSFKNKEKRKIEKIQISDKLLEKLLKLSGRNTSCGYKGIW